MVSPSTDRRFGLTAGVAIKAPCQLATTVNITLSGEQSIDGTTTDDSRVLAKDQTDLTENGIYRSDDGDWAREPDANGNRDLVFGTLVYVNGGSANASTNWVFTSDDPEIGTDDIGIALNTSFPVAVSNTTDYELGSQAAAASHTGIITGHVIRTNYLDGNRTAESGSQAAFTGTTTPGKAGQWFGVAADGFGYDVDGKQFEYGGNILKVEAFGVVANGVTDDTSAHNICSIAARNKGTATIDLHTGSSLFTDTILYHEDSNPAQGLSVIGHGGNEVTGKGTTFLWGGDSATPGLRATGNNIRGLHFEGFLIDGADLIQDSLWAAPTSSFAAHQVTFERLWIKDYIRTGLMLGDPAGSTYNGQMANSSARDIWLAGRGADALGIWAKGGTSEDFQIYNLTITNNDGIVSECHIKTEIGFYINIFGLQTDNLDDGANFYAIDATSAISVYEWITEDLRLLTTVSGDYDRPLVLSGVRQLSSSGVHGSTDRDVIFWRGHNATPNPWEAYPFLQLSGCALNGSVRFASTNDIRCISSGTTFAIGGFKFDGPSNASLVELDPSGGITVTSGGTETFNLAPTTGDLTLGGDTTFLNGKRTTFQGSVHAAATGGADTFVITFTNSGTGATTGVKMKLIGGSGSGNPATSFYKEISAYWGLSSDTVSDPEISEDVSIGDATKTAVTGAAPAAVGSGNQVSITFTNTGASAYTGEIFIETLNAAAGIIEAISIAIDQ